MIEKSGSVGRLPSLKINPKEVALSILLNCKTYDLVAVWDFDFFVLKWRWEQFIVYVHPWSICCIWFLISFSLFAIFAEECNLSAFKTIYIFKFTWTLDGGDLLRTFEQCFSTACSIKSSISDWFLFTVELELDTNSVLLPIYYVYFSLNLLQVKGVHFE